MLFARRRFGGTPRLLSTQRLLSTRAIVALEESILQSCAAITDPTTTPPKSLRSLGYLSISTDDDDDSTTLNVTLPSNFHPSRSAIVAAVESAIATLPQSIPSPTLTTSFKNHLSKQHNTGNLTGPGLAHTRAILPIYSCKGGVGKSTVATNLAFALAASDPTLRVGLLDCDVYGPSLPTLIRPEDMNVRRSELGKGMVRPLSHGTVANPVKVLSLGYVSPKSGVPGAGGAGEGVEPAVIRGPMASRVVTQLLKGTEWGSLDVLLLDLPPGTGDVQLTICQEIVADAAVAVTTPGELAKADVVKGVKMFETLGIPTIAAVENMAYFTNPVSKEKHYLLGRSIDSSELIPNQSTRDAVIRVPMSEKVSASVCVQASV